LLRAPYGAWFAARSAAFWLSRRFVSRRIAGFFGFRAPFAFISNFLPRVREVIDADRGIMRRANPNEARPI